ncbi:MAG: MFS transporter [Chloroflexi bacterium]|nr:MFS transporter [Chloroflexota bacterium]
MCISPRDGEAPGPATPDPGDGVFSSLRIRNFRLLWFGIVSHALALWMEQIARPYLIYELTESPLQLGGVIVARTLPQFGFGILAGVMIDWFDRKLVLQLSQYGALLLNVVFAALLIFDLLELWHIYAAASVRGATMAFDQPARQALVPAVVPADRVTNAIALLSATQNSMRIFGTAVAGFTIAVIGVTGAFVAIALIYVGAVVSTALLRVATHARPEESGAGAMLAGLGDAMRYAIGTPAIRGAISLALIHFAFGLSFLHLFAALFALEVLDIGPFGFGIMMSITGLGSLTGALIIASRSPRNLGQLLPLMMASMGALLIAFSLSSYVPDALGRPWLVLPLVLVFGVGLFQSGIFALVQVVVLDAAPDQMRGRLMGLLAFDRATMLMGAAAGGAIAEAIGVQRAQILYATLVIVGALAILIFARRFRRTVIGASVPTAEPGSRRHTAAGVRSAASRDRASH